MSRQEVQRMHEGLADKIVLVFDTVEGSEGTLVSQLRGAGWDAGAMGNQLEATLTQAVDAWVLDLDCLDGETLPFLQALGRLPSVAPALLVMDASYLDRHAAEIQEARAIWPAPVAILVRPYTIVELRLRLLDIAAPAMSNPPEQIYVAGPLRLDLGRRVVTIHGKVASLTPSEFGILRALVEAEGRVVPRPALTALLPRSTVEGAEATIESHVSRLRQKLGPSGPHLVRTIRGIGYALVTGEDEIVAISN